MLQSTPRRFGGLDGTRLKLIAMVFMLLDHIHYFFADFMPVPAWFTMVGRVVSPLFVFLLAEGFTHTRDRRRYFLRVWVIAAGMGIIQFCMAFLGWWRRADRFFPRNGTFLNFVVLFCIWQGIDWLGQRRFVWGALAVGLPFAWWRLPPVLVAAAPALRLPIALLGRTVLPSIYCITDGGIVLILEGIVLYVFRRRRPAQLAAFTALNLWLQFYQAGLAHAAADPGFTWGQMFTNPAYCQWMSVFAVVFMALYNGRRGRGFKALFYVFYPVHIYVLYALSCVLYPLAV